ncbi:MAG TPA: hypothetical protein VKB65_04405 [Myxococcota bacterium]|nr:hypothetical protein [Myxococcota bacterium]
MSTTEPPRAARRLARALRASAGLGMTAGLLLAAVALAAGARPWAGVPAWAWLALAFACLLVREAGPASGNVGPGRRRR